MKGRTIINTKGEVTTEVLDRQGIDCANVIKLTERLGTQVSEEITGPTCDTNYEIQGD